jgi:hypothetical protein
VSEKQMELSTKKIEKPRVLEQIHDVLNRIEGELETELGEIKKLNIKWSKNNDRNYLYLSPLMFPLSEKKPFYWGIQNIFVGQEKGEKEKFLQLLHSIDINLKKRHELYFSVNGELNYLEKKILNDNFPERIMNLFSKLPKYSLKSNESDNEDIFVTYFDGTGSIGISKFVLYDIITGMMISLIIQPSKLAQDISSYLGYQQLVIDLYPHIVNSLNLQLIPDIDYHIRAIVGDLNELDFIDKIIIQDVISLKELYRESYILTDNDLNPFSGI